MTLGRRSRLVIRVMPKAQKNMMARGMIIRAAGERSASLRYRESSMGNFLLLKKDGMLLQSRVGKTSAL